MKENIIERVKYLEDLIASKEKELLKAPEEVLNVSQHGNRIQYYKKNLADGRRTYIKKSDEKTIESLCQKDYNQKVILAAKKEIQYLQMMQEDYPTELCENIHEQLSIHRQSHIRPIKISDEQFIKEWISLDYSPKPFKENTPEHYTDNGERVRSKSEVLIANALKKHNIPYRYECPLYLDGYGTIHPDFTVLNVRLRKEFYWEHMGMTDDPGYLEEAFRRIDMYERNDIFPGDELILSHESIRYPLNSKSVDKLIQKHLL